MVGTPPALPNHQTAESNDQHRAGIANGRHSIAEDRPDDGDEESALLASAAPSSDGAPPPPHPHRATRPRGTNWVQHTAAAVSEHGTCMPQVCCASEQKRPSCTPSVARSGTTWCSSTAPSRRCCPRTRTSWRRTSRTDILLELTCTPIAPNHQDICTHPTFARRAMWRTAVMQCTCIFAHHLQTQSSGRDRRRP